MMKIDLSSHMLHDPDDFEAGGYIKINCDVCSYSGFVDVDDDGQKIRGNCESCGTSFESLVK